MNLSAEYGYVIDVGPALERRSLVDVLKTSMGGTPSSARPRSSSLSTAAPGCRR